VISDERRGFEPQGYECPVSLARPDHPWAVLIVIWTIANSTLSIVVVLLGATTTLPIA